MTSISYNNSDCTYLAVQALNSNQVDSNSIICNISQKTNPIVNDLSNYDVFLTSFTCNSSDLPYFNILRNISWDVDNFETNKTNMSITIMDTTPGEYNFDLDGNTNTLLMGINQNPNATETYQGVRCFLQYQSENSPLTDPNEEGTGANSSSYPRSYFNVHSIQQFLSMINLAIDNIVSNWGTNDAWIGKIYFYYDSLTDLFQFNCPLAFNDLLNENIYKLYVNSFLEYKLDGFRWQFLQNSNVSTANYTGMDYQLVGQNFFQNIQTYVAYAGTTQTFYQYYTYIAETVTLSNLIDVHSVLITTNAGSLQGLKQQIIPVKAQVNDSLPTSLNLPTVSCLKNLDFDFNTLALSGINNSVIQFQSSLLAYPINSLSNKSLNDIEIQVFIQTIDNEIYPLNIPAGGGYSVIKFALKKKNNN